MLPETQEFCCGRKFLEWNMKPNGKKNENYLSILRDLVLESGMWICCYEDSIEVSLLDELMKRSTRWLSRRNTE